MNVYKCDQCSSVFTDSSNMRRHKRYFHSNEKNFKCERCGTLFSRPDHLKRHYQRHDVKVEKLYCDINGCKRSFTNPDKLDLHRKHHIKKLEEDVVMIRGYSVTKEIVNGTTQFLCPFENCNKYYNSYSGVAKHLRNHSDPPKLPMTFPCDKCKKIFKTNEGRERHVKSKHTPSDTNNIAGNRVYFVCPRDWCRKIYTTKSNLNMHIARNHGNKINFKCDDCGYPFKWKKSLNLHKCKAKNQSL